jgi:hypothetical protein
MTLPSRQKQIQEIAKFLDSDHQEGRELAEIAADIVDAFHGLLLSGIKRPVLTPHVGMAFNHPALSGVWYVAYDLGDRLWLVSSSARYGWLVRSDGDVWQYAEESKDNRKAKEGEALKPRPGSPGNNPDWNAGDKVSQHQREFRFEVVATGDKCVLLLQDNGVYRVESNDNMSKYYRKEVEEKIKW